jgi:DNA-binding LacI/PurR family transcriptional regulator
MSVTPAYRIRPVPAKKPKETTIREIAKGVKLPVGVVRNVLKETPGLKVPREEQDRIFKAARKLGYDFRKLKLGKRLQNRKETLEEILEKISKNPGWSRDQIVVFLMNSIEMVARVQKRAFGEEYGAED